MESRVFEREVEAKRFVEKLNRDRPGQMPLVVLRVETRSVGPWRLSSGQSPAEATLAVLARLEPGQSGVPPRRWFDAVAETGVSRASFYRHVKSLLASGAVSKTWNDWYVLTVA